MSFFSALFDFSFSSYIAPKLVKALYVLSIIAAALMMLVTIIVTFASDRPVTGVITLLLSPFFFLLYVCLARLYLEFFIVIFRIAEDIGRIAQFELVEDTETYE